MLGRQERVALLLLVGVAVTVVAAHAVLNMIGKQPFAHPFSENSADGELVIVEGSVEKAMLIENGGHLALQVNNISVFVPATAARNLSVHKGDSILAYGIVQTYRGKKEIVISSAEDICITTIP
jgi:DNA/RNA endonuclease YhcR with UshA esterase domain